jgi:hypothetical protein
MYDRQRKFKSHGFFSVVGDVRGARPPFVVFVPRRSARARPEAAVDQLLTSLQKMKN